MHGFGGLQAKDIEHDLNSMQPIVPECSFSSTVAPNGPQSLRLSVQVRQDAAYIRRIERYVYDCVRPIELLREILGGRGLADHHRAGGGAFVESRGDLIAAGRVVGLVDTAAMGDEVAAVL